MVAYEANTVQWKPEDGSSRSRYGDPLELHRARGFGKGVLHKPDVRSCHQDPAYCSQPQIEPLSGLRHGVMKIDTAR